MNRKAILIIAAIVLVVILILLKKGQLRTSADQASSHPNTQRYLCQKPIKCDSPAPKQIPKGVCVPGGECT